MSTSEKAPFSIKVTHDPGVRVSRHVTSVKAEVPAKITTQRIRSSGQSTDDEEDYYEWDEGQLSSRRGVFEGSFTSGFSEFINPRPYEITHRVLTALGSGGLSEIAKILVDP